MDTANVKLIDLGLSSGTLWADRNIGAKSPEDAGLYFQWGDTQGYTDKQCGTGEGQKAFVWNDYKHGVFKRITKYNKTDNKTELDPEDDAATVNMGTKYSMPTKEQFIELFKETTPQLILSDNTKVNAYIPNFASEITLIVWKKSVNLNESIMKGIKFISKTDATKELFFPASGLLADGAIRCMNTEGFAWTASRGKERSGACCLNFYLDYITLSGNFLRYGGMPVRAVVNKTNAKELKNNI